MYIFTLLRCHLDFPIKGSCWLEHVDQQCKHNERYYATVHVLQRVFLINFYWKYDMKVSMICQCFCTSQEICNGPHADLLIIHILDKQIKHHEYMAFRNLSVLPDTVYVVETGVDDLCTSQELYGHKQKLSQISCRRVSKVECRYRKISYTSYIE